MSADEWDKFCKWFNESRLRGMAFGLSIALPLLWVVVVALYSASTGDDHGTPGYPGYEQRHAVWPFHTGIYLAIALAAIWAIPLVNGSILLARGSVSKALKSWNTSGVKRARLAEAKSAELEAELERMDRQLVEIAAR